MIDQRIGKIKVRRGTDAQRVLNTFEEGEVIYSIDKKRIFVGDDVTLGGVPVCNRNYIVESLGFPPSIPSDVLAGDIIFDKSQQKTYITNWTGTVYELLLISDTGCTVNLKTQIDNAYTKIRAMTGCLDPEIPTTPTTPTEPPTTPSKLIWVTQPTNNYVNMGDTATFTASAVDGSSGVSYVWKRFDSVNINTTNIYKNSITITDVQFTDKDFYYCIASNAVDSITSVNAELSLETNLIKSEDDLYILSELDDFILWESTKIGVTITQQPNSITASTGNNVSFIVKATGSFPISYQWQINGIDISGETNSTYSILNVNKNINNIRCKVSNIAGDVVSNSVNLTISP